MQELISKIKLHTLGNKKEAMTLYFEFCDCLKNKYGLVDRNYDANPTTRGKEWIDIHHILEYELDDIANRTRAAIDVEKRIRQQTENEVVIAVKSNEMKNNYELIQKIKAANPNVNSISIYGLDYNIEQLKPYNAKEQLVYANKIEHFLLHYLISSARGKEVFAGGPNYLWDCSVELDLYGFDADFKNDIKNNKDFYYSIMSSEEVTLLYKKLIDWKCWNVKECSRYWNNFKSVLRNFNKKEVSYIDNKDKFFKLLDILNYKLDAETIDKINTLPYKARIIKYGNKEVKVINYDCYSIDEKTVIQFRRIHRLKSFTIPNNVEQISETAFISGYMLEQLIIPVSVKSIANKAFTFSLCKHRQCPNLKKIIYKGTKKMWDEQFSNVELDGLTLVCKTGSDVR